MNTIPGYERKDVFKVMGSRSSNYVLEILYRVLSLSQYYLSNVPSDPKLTMEVHSEKYGRFLPCSSVAYDWMKNKVFPRHAMKVVPTLLLQRFKKKTEYQPKRG